MSCLEDIETKKLYFNPARAELDACYDLINRLLYERSHPQVNSITGLCPCCGQQANGAANKKKPAKKRGKRAD